MSRLSASASCFALVVHPSSLHRFPLDPIRRPPPRCVPGSPFGPPSPAQANAGRCKRLIRARASLCFAKTLLRKTGWPRLFPDPAYMYARERDLVSVELCHSAFQPLFFFFFFFLPCYFYFFFWPCSLSLALTLTCLLTCLFPFAAVCLPSPGAELELSLPRACQHMRSNRACLLASLVLQYIRLANFCADMPRLGSTSTSLAMCRPAPFPA